MSDAAVPVVEEVPDPQEVQKSLSKLGGMLSDFTNKFSQKVTESVSKTTDKTIQSVVSSGLGPISAAVKPLESFFGFNLGESISGLFKKAGTGLFGTGEDYKGPVSKNALKKMDPGSVLIANAIDGQAEEDKKEGFMKKLMRWLTGGSLIAAGIGFLLSGLTDDGPFKGLKKVIGRLLTKIGYGILEKVLKPIGKFFGRIWKGVKGILDKVWKPVKAFLGDKIWKPFKKFVGNILKPIGNFFGRIFKPIKSLFDEIIGFGSRMLGKVFKGGAKGGLRKVFRTVVDWVASKAGKLLKGLKFAPGIGSIVSIGFAISRFKQGDIVGGILEMVAGLADLVPGVGTAISWGLDIFLAARDLGAFKEGGMIKANLTDVFKNIWKWIKDKGGNLLRVIGGAISSIFTGAVEWVGEKIASFVSDVRDVAGVAGGWLQEKIMDPIVNWIGSKITSAMSTISDVKDWADTNIVQPIGSFLLRFWQRIKNVFEVTVAWLTDNIWTPLGSFFGGVWTKITDAWDSLKDWIDTNIKTPVKNFFSRVTDVFAEMELGLRGMITVFQKENTQQAFESLSESYGAGSARRTIENYKEQAGLTGLGAFNQAARALADMSYYQREQYRVDDAIIRPNGDIIRTHPDDTIIATKNSPVHTPAMDRSVTQSMKVDTTSFADTLRAEITRLSERLEEVVQNTQGVVQQNNNYTSRFNPNNLMQALTTEVQ